MKEEKPGLQSRLETLGWVFNAKAQIGEQWTKTDPNNGVSYNQRTTEWLYDFTSAMADQEMTRGQKLLKARNDYYKRQGRTPPKR
jgi:hypothetical protein